MAFSQSEEIKAKLNIVDIIQEKIPLKKAGANWKGICPFHTEKTPSFMVSEEKQIWHCFGCGQGGDIFEFVKQDEGIEFIDALKLLAQRAGVKLEFHDPGHQTQKARLLEILHESASFFAVKLRDQKFPSAYTYLRDRGLEDNTIDLFQIGFAPASWDALAGFLQSKGFRRDELLKTGVIIQSKKTNLLDRFRDRIMFPLRDPQGNVIGFTGRLLPGTESLEGKYVNTPTTELYDKSKMLYNFDLARSAIKKQNYVIVAEGQMDVISAWQAGTRNIIASSGTALTHAQLDLLGRYTKNIMFAFDMDRAGKGATDRAVNLALAQGFSIKVITLPEGKDPDDCIRENSELWFDAVRSAGFFMEYFLKSLLKEYDIKNISTKKEIAQILLSKILLIHDPVEREHWIHEIARAMEISEEILFEKVEQISSKNIRREEFQKETKIAPDPFSNIPEISQDVRIAEYLLSLSLEDEEFFQYLFSHIEADCFSVSEYGDLYKTLILFYNEKTFPHFSSFKQQLSERLKPEEYQMIIRLNLLFSKDYTFMTREEQFLEIKKGILLLRKLFYQKELHLIQGFIEEAEREGTQERLNELERRFLFIIQKIKEFSSSV